jgi:carbon monoxide dehydrogenase subunit G
MFTVRAGYSDQIEVRSTVERVRDFFSDIRNFVDLMPGITSIHTDAKGVTHWKIQAEIPVVGQMMQKFAVELAEDSAERIEWFPVAVETQNFLRYSAEFLEKAKNVTLVHFSQMVELRRRSARDLHMLAGLAGESLISSEMSKRITEMIKTFINRAKERLEVMNDASDA